MFVKKGSEFFVQAPDQRDLYENLPAQVYTVRISMVGYYLEIAESFELPPRLYGNTNGQADRILNTFNLRPRSTGVLLAGEKGSGKTLLSKVICVKAIEAGMPVLLINSPHLGDGFLGFLEEIKQHCVVLFDEFEKVYPDKENQAPLLTVFDGVFSAKKLFILTVNDGMLVTGPMKNRPGRLFYNIEFKGLGMDFIEEYCQVNLKDHNLIRQIILLSTLFRAFSFDMLQAVVEELNRYGERPVDLLSILNTKPDSGGSSSFTIALTLKGIPVVSELLYDKVWTGNPLTHDPCIEYYDTVEDKKSDTGIYSSQVFRIGNLKRMDVSRGVYEYSGEDGDFLVLTAVKAELPPYHQFLQ